MDPNLAKKTGYNRFIIAIRFPVHSPCTADSDLHQETANTNEPVPGVVDIVIGDSLLVCNGAGLPIRTALHRNLFHPADVFAEACCRMGEDQSWDSIHTHTDSPVGGTGIICFSKRETFSKTLLCAQ